jgi:uncharacterized membrane protein (UPF0127 family)
MKSSFVKIKDHTIPTLLAISDEEQQIGLMYRKELPPSMSFIYSYPKVNKFWMKNTYCPLDIIFCKQGRIIDICKGEPLSTRVVGPDDLTDLIIELPYGTCKQLGVAIGDEAYLPSIEIEKQLKP